ncbi:hypothetical protein CEXT_721421 [Caerostris extrusa]|uniref:Uncharacterized protein n=1 Tax=Caerostris extrusa TaxID=172846 RepID=A0AAV4QB41_CAEEX|nr:hypothetical protein CEXT_721421 [Caerostris extrusa]
MDQKLRLPEAETKEDSSNNLPLQEAGGEPETFLLKSRILALPKIPFLRVPNRILLPCVVSRGNAALYINEGGNERSDLLLFLSLVSSRRQELSQGSKDLRIRSLNGSFISGFWIGKLPSHSRFLNILKPTLTLLWIVLSSTKFLLKVLPSDPIPTDKLIRNYDCLKPKPKKIFLTILPPLQKAGEEPETFSPKTQGLSFLENPVSPSFQSAGVLQMKLNSGSIGGRITTEFNLQRRDETAGIFIPATESSAACHAPWKCGNCLVTVDLRILENQLCRLKFDKVPLKALPSDPMPTDKWIRNYDCQKPKPKKILLTPPSKSRRREPETFLLKPRVLTFPKIPFLRVSNRNESTENCVVTVDFRIFKKITDAFLDRLKLDKVPLKALLSNPMPTDKWIRNYDCQKPKPKEDSSNNPLPPAKSRRRKPETFLLKPRVLAFPKIPYVSNWWVFCK